MIFEILGDLCVRLLGIGILMGLVIAGALWAIGKYVPTNVWVWALIVYVAGCYLLLVVRGIYLWVRARRSSRGSEL